MSGALPTTAIPADVQFRSIQPARVSIAHSLKRQVRSTGAQRWAGRCTYGTLERAVFQPLWAFIVAQKGQYETFTLTLPGWTTPLGSWGGSPAVNGAVSAGAVSVAIDGLTAGVTGIGKAGDFVKFSGHSKVYQLAADVNSNGSGETTLTLTFGLLAALANNETLTVNDVPFTVALVEDQPEFPMRAPLQIEGFGFDWVEVY